jgi:hypothetical protein
MTQKNYLLVMMQRKHGHINHNLIEELTWLDLQDLKTLTTTLDPTFRNYPNWYSVLTSTCPTGVYTNLKLSGRLNNDNVPVISADSKPQLVREVTPKYVEELLIELARPKLTNFQKLFE